MFCLIALPVAQTRLPRHTSILNIFNNLKSSVFRCFSKENSFTKLSFIT
jgi:hypothetical protein